MYKNILNSIVCNSVNLRRVYCSSILNGQINWVKVNKINTCLLHAAVMETFTNEMFNKSSHKRVTHGMIPFIWSSKSGEVNCDIDVKRADTLRGHEKDFWRVGNSFDPFRSWVHGYTHFVKNWCCTFMSYLHFCVMSHINKMFIKKSHYLICTQFKLCGRKSGNFL